MASLVDERASGHAACPSKRVRRSTRVVKANGWIAPRSVSVLSSAPAARLMEMPQEHAMPCSHPLLQHCSPAAARLPGVQCRWDQPEKRRFGAARGASARCMPIPELYRADTRKWAPPAVLSCWLSLSRDLGASVPGGRPTDLNAQWVEGILPRHRWQRSSSWTSGRRAAHRRRGSSRGRRSVQFESCEEGPSAGHP